MTLVSHGEQVVKLVTGPNLEDRSLPTMLQLLGKGLGRARVRADTGKQAQQGLNRHCEKGFVQRWWEQRGQRQEGALWVRKASCF